MNIVQITRAARAATGENIGVSVKKGQFAVIRITRTPRRRTVEREYLTEWGTLNHVAAVLLGMVEDCTRAAA